MGPGLPFWTDGAPAQYRGAGCTVLSAALCVHEALKNKSWYITAFCWRLTNYLSFVFIISWTSLLMIFHFAATLSLHALQWVTFLRAGFRMVTTGNHAHVFKLPHVVSTRGLCEGMTMQVHNWETEEKCYHPTIGSSWTKDLHDTITFIKSSSPAQQPGYSE